jgi:hypothetical protein
MSNNHGRQVIAHLTPEELEEFKGVYESELALKNAIDMMMASAHKMGKELIHKRKEFWDKLLTYHNLEPSDQYAIDSLRGTLISVTEEDDEGPPFIA